MSEGPDVELAFAILHSTGKGLMPTSGRTSALFRGWQDRWDENFGLLDFVRIARPVLSLDLGSYYAIVTNWNLFEHPLQKVMEFYLKRGNAENFIREEKYGFDLKHFPCQELRANYTYAQFAMIAHNILRWVAVIQKPDKPHFSKKIRRRFVYVPGKVIHHARQVFLKIPVRFYEEVVRLKLGLRFNPDQPAFASGFA